MPYDSGRAKEYLAQCAVRGALVIKTSAYSNAFLRKLGGTIEASLEKALGINISIEQVQNFQGLVTDVKAGRILAYAMGWSADSRDFGYPSFALAIGNEMVTDPDVKELVTKRMGRASRKF